jgi:hypothetical protein
VTGIDKAKNGKAVLENDLIETIAQGDDSRTSASSKKPQFQFVYMEPT